MPDISCGNCSGCGQFCDYPNCLSPRQQKERIKRLRLESHVIPPITDPMGSSWRQPCRSEILIDGSHAAMTQRTFDALPEYSRSMPSGVYPGKMWKSVLRDGSKLLRWFAEVPGDPSKCAVPYRDVMIVKEFKEPKNA